MIVDPHICTVRVPVHLGRPLDGTVRKYTHPHCHILVVLVESPRFAHQVGHPPVHQMTHVIWACYGQLGSAGVRAVLCVSFLNYSTTVLPYLWLKGNSQMSISDLFINIQYTYIQIIFSVCQFSLNHTVQASDYNMDILSQL